MPTRDLCRTGVVPPSGGPRELLRFETTVAERSTAGRSEPGAPHALAVAGSVKRKTAPRGEFGAARIRPRCESMIERQMASPIPVPPCLVDFVPLVASG